MNTDFTTGDIIEWRYNPEYENKKVLKNEELYHPIKFDLMLRNSSTSNNFFIKDSFISIDKPALCLYADRDQYVVYMNDKIYCLKRKYTTPILNSKSCVWCKPVKVI